MCGSGVHTNTDPLAGSNLSTLETGFKRLLIQGPNLPGWCGQKADRQHFFPDSANPGSVWTGPKTPVSPKPSCFLKFQNRDHYPGKSAHICQGDVKGLGVRGRGAITYSCY